MEVSYQATRGATRGGTRGATRCDVMCLQQGTTAGDKDRDKENPTTPLNKNFDFLGFGPIFNCWV